MIKIASLLALSCALSQPVAATTIEVGVQWNVVPGFNAQWIGATGGGCNAPNQGGVNCAQIPSGMFLRDCRGTITAKMGGEELLGRLVVGNGGNFEQLWVGEMFGQSTQVVQAPMLNPEADSFLSGGNSVWVEYQANAPGYGGGLEFQVTCTVW